jgi:membrane-bound lytic murein transglycosylase MltF
MMRDRNIRALVVISRTEFFYDKGKPRGLIRDVSNVDANIEAGAKMLKNIRDTYFNGSDINPLNKMLLSFASYNAGPSRIARLRKVAKEQGLDPDQWFGNMDLVVAKDIGQETVVYVSNIFKYYIAYRLTLEQAQAKAAAGSPAPKTWTRSELPLCAP